jgi:outer membrane protein, heavy metal efflux system
VRSGEPTLRDGAEGIGDGALAQRVTQRFIDVLALQERAALAQKAVETASQTLGIVGARVDVGRSLEAERATATVALAQAELARADIEGQLDTARMSLASLWSASSPNFSQAEGDLYTLPPIETFEALSMQLDDNPDRSRFGTAGS